MKKQFSNKDLDEFMSQAYKNSVHVNFLMLSGYPTETHEEFLETVKMFERYVKYQSIIDNVILGTTLGILPGTPLAEELKDDVEMNDGEKNLFGIDKLNIKRSDIPAVTHVDYSARIQTVTSDTNPLYHLLIREFYKKTGCPIIVNTSFNVRGEPIICTPTDALKCFMGTELDVLAVGNFILYKESQDEALKENYEGRYELD